MFSFEGFQSFEAVQAPDLKGTEMKNIELRNIAFSTAAEHCELEITLTCPSAPPVTMNSWSGFAMMLRIGPSWATKDFRTPPPRRSRTANSPRLVPASRVRLASVRQSDVQPPSNGDSVKPAEKKVMFPGNPHVTCLKAKQGNLLTQRSTAALHQRVPQTDGCFILEG